MQTAETQLYQLNEKLQVLIKAFQALQKDKAGLQKQLEKLMLENTSLADRASQLQQENLILKTSAGTMNPAEKKTLEAELNAYLKNIDTCISLLSA